jgi:two-component system, sensor histidine kinase and response regulator
MNERSEFLFREHRLAIYKRTDRMFAVLLGLQYFAGIAAALWVSPRTWTGAQSAVHFHVWSAVFLGAVIVSLPIALAVFYPGRVLTRHVIAVGQMLDSALLIHLSGGRIETHFHVFGSLAFLGFYRDWRVLISASIVVAVDHFFRGLYWPQSVYGVLSPGNWRWLEHSAWVIFEDIFITLACLQSTREMREIAEKRAYAEFVAHQREQDVKLLEQTRGELKIALQSKEAFFSMCGHELKTPLTSLGLQIQLAKKVIKQNREDSPGYLMVEKLVDQTEVQVGRLLRILQDMLDHSRLQLGKFSIYPSKISLNELVRDVVERYQPLAQAAGCCIWLEGNETVEGSWDQARIEQVVTNLISNAIKYGSQKPIEINVRRSEENAIISVRDHGVGISPTFHERIFQQFERLEETHHIAGMGLGLYITRKIVERHGGTVRVESELGKGSFFIVELPLNVSELDYEAIPSASHDLDKADLTPQHFH